MGKLRVFTKSIYKKALECPTKLFYLKKPSEYANEDKANDFLKALARGGFQVGALARCYYPKGHLIDTLDHEDAVRQTDALLNEKNVIIFEAAFKFENYFIRVDILRKQGNLVDLMEVKSKSADPAIFEDELWAVSPLKQGIYQLKAVWYDYIYDVAFQTFVLRKSKPDFTVTPYLVCADKSKKATVDGLNQKFLVRNNNSCGKIEIHGDVSLSSLGTRILCDLDVTEAVDKILSDEEMSEKSNGLQFQESVELYSKMFVTDKKISTPIGKHCKTCEFRSDDGFLKSGFHECWKELADLTAEQMSKPLIYDIWRFLGSNDLIKDRKYFLTDASIEDVDPKEEPNRAGLSQSQRQWLQVEHAQNNSPEEYIDMDGLSSALRLKYPLHFIDFETCMVAIPFSKGRRPYEQIAFQFSHHIVHEDGRIEHQGQYINAKPGVFPNFDFVRALKKELENDNGSIFRYSHHENTVLNQIRDQLAESTERDKDDLITWIKTITYRKGEGIGLRSMIDLCELEMHYYFHPATGGSNSIKKVLPAILNESKFLQDKYSKAIYGKHEKIVSRNFDSQIWIELKDGKVLDPYSRLPKVFNDYDRNTLDLLMDDDELADGGAAMTAYAYLQFSEMSDDERGKIESALLKYCELDTFAMVMIWEHWMERIKSPPNLTEPARQRKE